MILAAFNTLSQDSALAEMLKCCHSQNWASQMVAARPFPEIEAVHETADRIWADCGEADALEAFRGHPKIGDIKSLGKKYAATEDWSSGEQSGVNSAQREILEGLAAGNRAYEEKFGFIFIVCATGKTAGEMLALLRERLPNDRTTELRIAMAEQLKITHIRINKLLQ